MIGTMLGHHRILERIGGGGMGEVYLALDTRLQRKVALKILPADLALDAERMSRFSREAQALAALDHPGIVTIYSIDSDTSPPYLTMELVEGHTLDHERPPSGHDFAAWLDIARQLTGAVAAAHEKGVVHRDLKPSNVMIDGRGRVRVLDFGLAKVVALPGPSALAETIDSTRHGRVMGTPAYMSPEQARGGPVGDRSDVFSLAVVLYELACGRRPFTGETHAEVLAALLRDAPAPVRDAKPEFPAELDRLLHQCLDKAPERRPSSHEVLDRLRASEALVEPASRPATSPRLVQITFADAVESSPAWSPDGQEIAFAREVKRVRKIFRKKLDEADARAVTESSFDDSQVTWSPDGERLLFVRSREAGRQLEPGDPFGPHYQADGDVWVHELRSRREHRLLENAFNPAFSPDGSLIAVDASWGGPRRIWITDARGHNPQQVTSDLSEAVTHIRPRWAPDGRRIVFQNVERTRFDIRVVDLGTREMTWLTRDLPLDVQPAFSPLGRDVYFSSYRSGGLNIWRVPVSEAKPAGSPRQVTTGAGQDVEAALSPDGRRLAFVILRQNADLWRLPLSPETGRPTGPGEKLIATTREESRGAWSPDGQRVAFNSDRTGEMNLWLFSLDDSSLTQVTRGPGGDYQPTWSPDGRQLAFFSSRAGLPGVWTVDLATGDLAHLSPPGAIEINPFFSPDGTRIAYVSDRDGRLEVWVMNADGTVPRQLTRIGVIGHFLRWTRDGRWIYFTSSSGGSPRTMRIAADGDAEPEALAPVAGGSHISLSPDESRVLDVVGHKTLHVSPLHGGAPEKIFEFDDPGVRIDYPVWSPDGRWVLFDRFRPEGGDIWMLDGIT